MNDTKFQVMFRDAYLIQEITNARHPMPDDEDDITPRMEKEQEAFMDEFFEYGDYGRFEIDAKTLACRLVPRKEWK